MSLSTVKKPDGLVEKGVPESAGPRSQTAVALARGQQLEKFTVRVAGVLDDLRGLLLATIWYRSAIGVSSQPQIFWPVLTTVCIALRLSAVQLPYQEVMALCVETFNCPPVEGTEDIGAHAKFPQTRKVEQALLGLPHYSLSV